MWNLITGIKLISFIKLVLIFVVTEELIYFRYTPHLFARNSSIKLNLFRKVSLSFFLDVTVMSDVHAVEKLWMRDGIEPSRKEPRPKHNRLFHHPTRWRVIYFHLYSFCKCGHNSYSIFPVAYSMREINKEKINFSFQFHQNRSWILEVNVWINILIFSILVITTWLVLDFLNSLSSFLIIQNTESWMLRFLIRPCLSN